MQFKSILKNVSYSFSVNMLSALISVIMVLVLPKVMGLEEYGVWQLYLFYLSYVGFFHFGWIDGIYLRYGGESYAQLNKKVFSGQFYAIFIFISCISAFFMIVAEYCTTNEFSKNALIMVSLVGAFVILTTFVNFILQFTNRIKDYAKLIFYEKVLFVVSTIFYVIFSNFISYKGMFLISFITELVTLIYAVFLIKDIINNRIDYIGNILKEAVTNIAVGSKLMFANIAGMLLIGIIRFSISQGWDLETFGKVSLTLSISNFLMVFIGAVSVVLFPVLKRTNEENLPEIYVVLRNCLSVFMLGILIFYYPLKYLLSIWLPNYADSLIYMAILLPVCLFESKVSMLINTYLKSLRQELLLLKINWVSAIVCIIITFLNVSVFHNLNATVFSIVFIFAFRCTLAEYFLSKLLKIEIFKDIFLELVMVILFITISWNFDNWLSVAIYGMAYILYLLTKKKDIQRSFNVIKEYVVK